MSTGARPSPDPPHPRRAVPSWRSVRTGGSAVVDQVVSSGTQLLLVVLVAHRSSATVLGAVSVGVVVHGFLLGSVRAMVGDVTLIRCRRAGADIAEEARLGLGLASAFGLASGVGVAAVAVALGGQVGHALLPFALAAPLVHAQDLLRSVAYGARRIHDAVVIDSIWLVVQVIGSGALLLADRATATGLVLAWVGGAACSLAWGWAVGRPRIAARGTRAWLRADGRRSLGFLGDYVVSTGIVQASFLVLSAVFTLAEFGSFRLAFVAVSPLANLLAGVRSLTLGRVAGTDGDRAIALRRASRAVPVFVGVAAVYGAVVTLAPTSVGELAFGGTWSSARTLVGAVALGEALRVGGLPALDVMRVFASPSVLVRTRVLNSTVLIAAVVTGGTLGDARGAVWAIAVAMAVATAMWWRSAVRIGRSRPTTVRG